MADDRHRMKEAMTALTVMAFGCLALGSVVPFIIFRVTKESYIELTYFVVVGAALISVRHVLRAIDRRLTSLERKAIDRRAAEHEKERAD